MSWQSLADVFEYVQRTDDLSTNEVVVLLALANFTNAKGEKAFPSHPTLQALTKLSKRALSYTVRALEHRGVLRTTLQRGRRGFTHYTLHLPHVQLKGAPHAPYPAGKGAPRASLKVHHMHPDPGSEIQESSNGTKDLETILARLGLSPDSNIYQWSVNGHPNPGDEGS